MGLRAFGGMHVVVVVKSCQQGKVFYGVGVFASDAPTIMFCCALGFVVSSLMDHVLSK